MNMELLRDSVTLKIHRGDNTDYTAEFDTYYLTSVRAVERFGTTPEMTEKNAVDVYFFPSVSKCTDGDGQTVPLPHASYGDEAVISLNGEEKTFRVAYAEYRNGIGSSSHVKLRLN